MYTVLWALSVRYVGSEGRVAGKKPTKMKKGYVGAKKTYYAYYYYLHIYHDDDDNRRKNTLFHVNNTYICAL